MADQQIALMEIDAVRELIDFADFDGSGFCGNVFAAALDSVAAAPSSAAPPNKSSRLETRHIADSSYWLGCLCN